MYLSLLLSIKLSRILLSCFKYLLAIYSDVLTFFKSLLLFLFSSKTTYIIDPTIGNRIKIIIQGNVQE